MGENPVGIVIVSRAVATRQSSCGAGVNLKSGGPVFLSPPWFWCDWVVLPLIVMAMTPASIT
jgi:hypothetical protein